MIKMIGVAMLSLCLFTGCWLSSAAAIFPAVAAVVSDASAVLSIIQQAVTTWFAHKPDPALEAKFNAAITKAWTALRAATAATQGAESLSQEEYDQAFADFQLAYEELHSLLKQHGILTKNMLSMGPNRPELEIVEPLAISFKVQ